jgi:hypothetical protein
MGIITPAPHLLHGTTLNGGKSACRNSLAPHPPHETIRNCRRSSFDSLPTPN